jgi:catechol 2,3-dioxygenase-like lactoylglutathione lyase family enzyme
MNNPAVFTRPDYAVLIVADLERAVRFYSECVGIQLEKRSATGHYAQLNTGTTRVGLYSREGMAKTLGLTLEAPSPTAPGFALGFNGGDVDAAYARLIAGGASAAVAPENRPWGQRTAWVRDPDGHLVELSQNL